MSTYDTDISHEHKRFENIIWEGKTIQGREFFDCTFYKCSLKECSFVECTFDKCTFEDCDVSLIQLKKASFSRITFMHCKVIGVAWGNANNPITVSFHHSRISYSSFSGKNLKKGAFINCQADEVDFTGCNLSQCDFSGTDLAGARFSDCDLTQANFVGATRYTIAVGENKLKKARFSIPEALSLLYSLGIEIVE